MDKKGDYKYAVIVMLILAIIVFGILVFYEKTFADIAEEEMDWETCRLSIIGAQVSTRIPLKESYLACPRYDRIFEKETPDEVNKKITEDMDHTIRTMGGGGMDFSKGNTFSSKKGCIVFASYRFNEGQLKKEFEGNPVIFIDWLKKNYVSPGKAYFNYFEEIEKKFNENKIKLNLLYDKVIKPDKTYFLYASKTHESEIGGYFSWLAGALKVVTGGNIDAPRARNYWQKVFFPDRAIESFTEEEVEKILKTTRIVLADEIMLQLDCDEVYYPDKKSFRDKWEEDFKDKKLLDKIL